MEVCIMQDDLTLSNPLSTLLNKSKEDFVREDLVKIILEKKIERITFHYTALDGKLKELKLPISSLYQAERILTDGERVDGSSLYKGMVDASLSDLYVVPVYKTAFLNPFDDSSLDFICRYLDKNGVLAFYTLDSILLNAVTLFRKKTHLDFWAMGEIEFYLISEPESRTFASAKQHGYHEAGPFVKTGAIVNQMVHHIAQITGSVKYAHSEVGYLARVRSDLDEIKDKQAEQLEIEFLPAPVEEMGDHLVVARWLIRNIAYRSGCVATFTPKLEEGVAGNGFHIHMELRKNGKNIMTGKDGLLTTHAKKLIGGLCTYADTLTAFGNTVSSAYLRLVPNQEAPIRICWSDLNRSAMIRVPLGWSNMTNLAATLNPAQKSTLPHSGNRQTIELRSPDGSAIVHLLLAGIVMSAEWGLYHEDSLQIAEKLFVTGNIFKDQELLSRLPALPKSCMESSRILLEKRELYEREQIFPKSIIEYVSRLLRDENDDKINQQLGDLPADDRLQQTRMIMHKDLHRH